MIGCSSSPWDARTDAADNEWSERFWPRGFTASWAASPSFDAAGASRFAEAEACGAGRADMAIVIGRVAPNRKTDNKKKTSARKESEATRPRDICPAVESPLDKAELLIDPASAAGPRSTGGGSESTRCSRGRLGSRKNQFELTDGRSLGCSLAEEKGAWDGAGDTSRIGCMLGIALGAMIGATKLAHSCSTSTS